MQLTIRICPLRRCIRVNSPSVSKVKLEMREIFIALTEASCLADLGRRRCVTEPEHCALSRPTVAMIAVDSARIEYEVPGEPKISVCINYKLQSKGGTVVLVRGVEVRASTKLKEDLTISLPNWPGKLPLDTWLPLPDGSQGMLGNKPAGYDFQGPNDQEHMPIQIPMVTFGKSDSRRVTIASDPYFSTLFVRDHMEWTYPKAIGLEDEVERRRLVTVIHEGGPASSLDAFYTYALPDVPPGPQWVHDIAMVDYDYLSKGGRGWFRDIDALAAALAPEERKKVFLCMHGWYDWCGRYSFDVKTKKFEPQWTAFGNAALYKDKHDPKIFEDHKIDDGFFMCESATMTPETIRERLAYAKAKGFRVGLYFADGLNAGTALPDFSSKLVLKTGAWVGPDTCGTSYCMNPLAPEVRNFFDAYSTAVLEKFGSLVDALVWDETFMVGANTYGSVEIPGYSSRAMMRLIRMVANKVETHNPQMALLSSDDVGLVPGAPSYAMVAHGTYQDAWFKPSAWAPGIYSNWRNALWGCCWRPITMWNWVEFGVKNYQAPVPLSNGWGDNTGFADMSPDMQRQVLELFRRNATHRTQMKIMESLP